MARNEDPLRDLVPDILSKLPVKSLMRFKCVHKSWCHLITNPNFILKHLVSFNQINTKDDITLLVRHTTPFLPGHIIRAVVSKLSFNQAINSSSVSILDTIINQNQISEVEILGPCNGLYFICSYPYNLLVNPSMRESRFVPDCHFAPKSIYFGGFGFDTKTNDYKIVMLTHSQPWQAQLYTLSSSCWREVDCSVPSSISILGYACMDTFVHGAFHWRAYDDGGMVIVAFDMVDEIFRIIRFVSSPREFDGHIIFAFDSHVVKFKESLAMIVCPFYGQEKCLDFLDLWVMEEYGNEGSWTKHLTIGPLVGVEMPLGFWKEDQFLLEDSNGRIVLYDLQTQEIKPLGNIIGFFHYLNVAIYVESIVSLRKYEEHDQEEVSFFEMVHDPLFD